MNAFTKALSKELAPSGVTVNAVAPGAVHTAMLANLQEDEMRMLEEEIPAGRLASLMKSPRLFIFSPCLNPGTLPAR